jgi:hypothetical protein
MQARRLMRRDGLMVAAQAISHRVFRSRRRFSGDLRADSSQRPYSTVLSVLVGWYCNCLLEQLTTGGMAMTFTNEGTWDRTVRILGGIALAYAAWILWPGTLSLVLLVVGVIALVTGVVGWCPGYAVFNWSTKRRVAG